MFALTYLLTYSVTSHPTQCR